MYSTYIQYIWTYILDSKNAKNMFKIRLLLAFCQDDTGMDHVKYVKCTCINVCTSCIKLYLY